jgi:multidrug transporter EmrE-like cation transporter
MVNILLLTVSISLAIAGQMLMKAGMLVIGKFPVTQLIPMFFSIVFQPLVFAGIFFFGVSSVFWLVVLSRIQLSMAYPLVSIGYIVVAILSSIFFKETVSIVRWAGIVTICVGVLLISRS